MPRPLETGEEIQLQGLKHELTKIATTYTEEEKTGLSNLSKEQIQGLKSLKKRQKDGEIVIFRQINQEN